MNKFAFFILCLFLCPNIAKAQRTLNLKTMVETKGIGRTIPSRGVRETQNGVVVTYLFNNIVLQNDQFYPDATTINIDGFWPNSSIGKPAILSRWDTFVVPINGANVIVSDSSFVDIPMELSPARPLLTNSGNDIYSKDNVIPIDSYKGLFPSSSISATRNDNYRGQYLLDVCVTPIQYDYLNKKVRIYTMIQYEIRYNVSALKSSLSKFRKERANGNTFLENIALNVSPINLTKDSKGMTSSADRVSNKYLIISVPKYAMAVNRFAEWKKTLGFDVQIAMQESWDTTMVKNTVQNACVPDTIGYLLIVGGQNDVPGVTRNQYFNNANHYHPTDLYYGCLDDGYTPDFFRGRVPVTSSSEAMTVVDKIINYEKNPVTDEFFYKRGVHCAYFQDRNYYNNYGVLTQRIDSCEDRRFVFTSERIRDSLLCVIDSITRIYYTEDSIYPLRWNKGKYAHGEAIPLELTKPTFKWDGDSADIANCINQKAFYVLMRDHGAVKKWGSPSFTNNDIDTLLHNGVYLPVVFSICCLTGKFDENNCFCERFLKKENGGCVATFGATQSSLSGPNDVMAEGMFDAIWPSLNLRPAFGKIDSLHYSPTPTPTYRLGQILDQGLKRCNEAYLNTDYSSWYTRYTYELFHCFGDPSMMIYTDKPTTFSNASINRQNNGMIYVNTGGVLATITFYNRRTNEIVSYRGTMATHTDDPEISVCISAHNMIPYLDEGTLYIQNQTLTDGGYYEAKSIKVGKNVTSSQPQGNANFSRGDYCLVGKGVELHLGTIISVGTTMKIKTKQ